jgi:hypothetical protein
MAIAVELQREVLAVLPEAGREQFLEQLATFADPAGVAADERTR